MSKKNLSNQDELSEEEEEKLAAPVLLKSNKQVLITSANNVTDANIDERIQIETQPKSAEIEKIEELLNSTGSIEESLKILRERYLSETFEAKGFLLKVKDKTRYEVSSYMSDHIRRLKLIRHGLSKLESIRKLKVDNVVPVIPDYAQVERKVPDLPKISHLENTAVTSEGQPSPSKAEPSPSTGNCFKICPNFKSNIQFFDLRKDINNLSIQNQNFINRLREKNSNSFPDEYCIEWRPDIRQFLYNESEIEIRKIQRTLGNGGSSQLCEKILQFLKKTTGEHTEPIIRA